MSADAPQKEPSGGKKGLRRPKRRLGIRIDMTPMVDIAFLLLIFYMVTTIFAAPQAMEINLPPAEEETEGRAKVKRMNLLNLYVDKEGDFYYDIGRELNTDEDIKVPWPIPADSLRDLFSTYAQSRFALNTLLIVHPDAEWQQMVNLLDEIEVVEAGLRRNEEFMQVYKAARPDEDRYSFRYAIDHWTARHDKKMGRVYEEYGLSGGDGS
jgi:biopolymer transport protein ExbD